MVTTISLRVTNQAGCTYVLMDPLLKYVSMFLTVCACVSESLCVYGMLCKSLFALFFAPVYVTITLVIRAQIQSRTSFAITVRASNRFQKYINALHSLSKLFRLIACRLPKATVERSETSNAIGNLPTSDLLRGDVVALDLFSCLRLEFGILG